MGSKLSKTRLARLRDVMSGYVERGKVPGVAALVSRHGEVHVEAIGAKSAGGGDPVRRDTIFRIASMTKPITAAAAMILVEECRLRLDDPVDRLLPELADRRVLRRLDGPLDDTEPARRPITLRDLLTFRMGFGILMAPPGSYPIQTAASEPDLGQGMPQPQTPPAPDQWIRRFGTLPLMHQPGEKWVYNTGSDVLGVLIARASGQPFEAFLRERLFEPLGMRDTAFSVPPASLDRFATSYWTNPRTGAAEVYDMPEGGQWSRPPAFPSGGGGLVSTVDDYLSFAGMLLNHGKNGGERILSRAAVEIMTADHLTPAQKAVSELAPRFFDNHGWGFGVAVVTRRDSPAEPVGQYGWNGGLGTAWFSDPSAGMVGILLTQRAWTSPIPPDICLDFWTLAYQAIDD
ncbi:MAG TPA: serine hydrolase domain-containing protein [Stellaceae bacterium]|jgi:CubicO group peptidase (beta-lactamase class C family)|nr:serine hydrolase domain-containing protein [Stellaceae bacterium]